jgi:hypothetical protein
MNALMEKAYYSGQLTGIVHGTAMYNPVFIMKTGSFSEFRFVSFFNLNRLPNFIFQSTVPAQRGGYWDAP